MNSQLHFLATYGVELVHLLDLFHTGLTMSRHWWLEVCGACLTRPEYAWIR